MAEEEVPEYVKAFRGAFINMLRWQQFESLWVILKSSTADWYIYDLNRAAPQQAATRDEWLKFLSFIEQHLRQEHSEDYCGIVYADDTTGPTFIKIYDPNNLGVVCGASDHPPPLPGWTLTRMAPVDIDRSIFPSPVRPKWWQQVWRSVLNRQG